MVDPNWQIVWTEGDFWDSSKSNLCSMLTVPLSTKKTTTTSKGPLYPLSCPPAYSECFVLPEAYTLVSLKRRNKKYNNLIAASLPRLFPFFLCYSYVHSQAPN